MCTVELGADLDFQQGMEEMPAFLLGIAALLGQVAFLLDNSELMARNCFSLGHTEQQNCELDKKAVTVEWSHTAVGW